MLSAELIRHEFKNLAPNYFNAAYFGPTPLRAQQAMKDAVDRFASPFNIHYTDWRPIPDLAREKIAPLLGVSPDSISNHGGTGEMVATVSNGYPFKAGDQVVVMEGDYPSDVLSWMTNEKRRGYEVVRLSEDCFRDPDLLVRRLPPQTKVMNITHVMFNTGRRNNLAAIGKLCQERGILFVVDTAQSLGGVALTPEEVAVCDVLGGCTYKWLLAPYGHAFGYWSKRALELVENTHLSWLTSAGSVAGNLLNYTTESTGGARKYDRSQAAHFVEMKGALASWDVIREAGLSNIEAHNKALVTQFLETYPKSKFNMITPVGEHANILCMRAASGVDSVSLQTMLTARKIDASIREGNLRLSFHLYNTPEEVAALVEALAEL